MKSPQKISGAAPAQSCSSRSASAMCVTITTGTRNWHGMWYVPTQNAAPDSRHSRRAMISWFARRFASVTGSSGRLSLRSARQSPAAHARVRARKPSGAGRGQLRKSATRSMRAFCRRNLLQENASATPMYPSNLFPYPMCIMW